MNEAARTRELIRRIAGSDRNTSLIHARVNSVDASAQTMEVEADGLTLTGVRLCSVIDSDRESLVIEPKPGSMVLLSDLSGGAMTDLVAVKYSEVKSISVKNVQIEINGGGNNGLVKIDKLVEKLNDIENDINNLKAAFNGWTPVPQDGGLALQEAATTWAGAPIGTTQRTDLEDPKVKH